MITSKITGKTYSPTDVVYISNVLQVKKMLDYLGPEDLYDILWTSEKRPDALVFVWARNDRTKECKLLWDQHKL